MINYDQKIKKINQQKEQLQKQKEYLLKKQQIKELKRGLRAKIKLSTSKILMYFLLLNCTAIEIYTGIVTIININIARQLCISPDLTPLVTLISAVVGETIGFAIYSAKAAKQNCKGGIVYEQAMFEANNNLIYNNQEDNVNGMDCR